MAHHWEEASQAWRDVLHEMAAARDSVGCQRRSAWYRGVRESTFPLEPSIYRENATVGQLLAKTTTITEGKFHRIHPNALRNTLNNAAATKRLPMQYRREFENLLRYVEDSSKSPTRLVRILNELGSIPKEIDAFHEFENRARLDDYSSWSILTLMRHHHVMTRLLDWSESALVALYFALEEYIEYLIPMWRDGPAWEAGMPPFEIPLLENVEPPTPAVWVMNPFHLAECSRIFGAIPYPDHPPLPDYYHSLLVEKDWPYARPIPLHAPRVDTRIESQRGHFTVHGYNARPLDEQIKPSERDGVVVLVRINPVAAMYGCYFLWQYANFDRFELYRDRDSLGATVAGRHFPADLKSRIPDARKIRSVGSAPHAAEPTPTE